MKNTWVPDRVLIEDTVSKFSTPTFIYSSEVIKRNYLSIENLFNSEAEIYYSLKANPNLSIVSLLESLGAGAEVSSLAELHTALAGNVPNHKIILVGPGKSDAEISLAIDSNIGAIVCESLFELERISSLHQDKGKIPTKVMLRVNPSFIGKSQVLTMAGKPRQFGIDEDLLIKNKEKINSFHNIEIVGFHAYMGTRFLDSKTVVDNTLKLLEMFSRLSVDIDINLQKVDVGGGYGVPYYDNEESLDLSVIGNELRVAFSDFKAKHNGCSIITELGRYLVASSGVMLSKVVDIKESMGEIFVITDGGMNVNMAASGVGSFSKRNFPVVNFNEEIRDTVDKKINITGPLCTPTDTMAKNISMGIPKVGDNIGFLMSGAYGPTASPVYFLSHGYPAEVMYESGVTKLIRRRDEVSDILEPQLI